LELGILEQLPSLRISAIFGQPGNVMFYMFYDIIAEVIAAQRFPAWAVLVDAR
jgi:3-methyladenine DNA glycosylase Mpg